jgi:hypothetical protein
MKTKLQIKTWGGALLFEYESEDNSIRKTVEAAIAARADLSSANLSSANLSFADLSFANLSSANLSFANLSFADLSSANLRSADLRSADLRSAKNIPDLYVNLCSRDILFVFEHLKGELPGFREKLIKGEIDGTQYEGDCACLIGTLGKLDGGVNKVCQTIPYYDKGLHNFGEQWFWQIHKGDTPENNTFSAHALKLLDSVLGTPAKPRRSKTKATK